MCTFVTTRGVASEAKVMVGVFYESGGEVGWGGAGKERLSVVPEGTATG